MARRRLDVDGRTVFITGAARGIGAATRRAAAREGRQRRARRARARAARGARREARRPRGVVRGRRDRSRRARARGRRRRSSASAASTSPSPTPASTRWARCSPLRPSRSSARIEVNLFGVWRTDRAVLPQIVERKGYLLNIASLAAASHAPLMGPYAASKAGVEGADRLAAGRAGADRRAGGLRLLRLHRHRSRARQLRAPVDQGDGGHDARLRSASRCRSRPPSTRSSAGIERRSGRVWAPRFVGGALALRGHPAAAHRDRARCGAASCPRRSASPIPRPAPWTARTRLLGVAASADPDQRRLVHLPGIGVYLN